MSETAKLKPCPFCGGEAKVYFVTGMALDYWAGCDVCRIHAKFRCDALLASKDGDTKAKAVEAWNRRAVASLSHTMGVKVRELEWVQEHPRHHHADSIVADYGVIGVTANTNYRLYRDTFEIPCPDGHYWPFEAAKAAAQADYEQRIRSALTPTQQPVGYFVGEITYNCFYTSKKIAEEVANELYPKPIIPVYASPQAVPGWEKALADLIGESLQGPTHGAWDRGRIAGLREARRVIAALNAEVSKS